MFWGEWLRMGSSVRDVKEPLWSGKRLVKRAVFRTGLTKTGTIALMMLSVRFAEAELELLCERQEIPST
jgi:hypothetical protein